MSIVEQLDTLCRYIIVHSIIYYDLNFNLISDRKYDKAAKDLFELVQAHRDILPECYYYRCLKDYDPSTGFDLKYRVSKEHQAYLLHLAEHIVWMYKKEFRTVGHSRL